MERKILSYSISLALCLLMFLPLRAQNGNPTVPPQGAPPKKEKKDAKEEVHYPLYNGMSVGLDLWGIGSSVFGGDFLSSEVAVDVNLKNRFFPIAELGYGSTDTWSDKGIHYKSNAPYFRIGMDYNTLYKKQHGHMLLVGLRYGVSSFKYDVDALGLDDPIYGGIVGNPNLYADQAQAVVDCLHRDSLVPKDYTVSRFNKEFSGTDGNTSFDMQNLQVRSCLVSNGYNMGYATDDTEQLW